MRWTTSENGEIDYRYSYSNDNERNVGKAMVWFLNHAAVDELNALKQMYKMILDKSARGRNANSIPWLLGQINEIL